MLAEVSSAISRSYVVDWVIECCSSYNGNYFRSDLSFILRPSEMFEFATHYVATFFTLPTGNVGIHVLSLSTGINITPDMQILGQVQIDNISRRFGASFLYRWEYEPGNELFIGFGQSALVPGTTFEPEISHLSVRLGQTFRF